MCKRSTLENNFPAALGCNFIYMQNETGKQISKTVLYSLLQYLFGGVYIKYVFNHSKVWS